ncbi:iron-siderophore ABC transporter substrate-binding protein [Paractinoplanes lichenicola]|uniref:Iron-siderophore ABC transporter substrate-binding protein n=1 Tax=Paractinoplanes lichenicola TaxID=2802976 RepID=A0ABS1VSJ1_9ACTN|nr:iron-siderophore ABC transporter substrate-binding protein [Actinoplanes lichenicola]MBL7256846.1 iron-siderophore ABC transporter substrate-binding protein [Actinoplanes lichenicola]
MRLLTIRLAAVGLLLTLTACGPNSANDEPAAGSSSSASDAFPVSVAHKFGTAEIKSEPKRIVTVGLVEQDALLALGIVPVGTTEWFGEKPGAIWPWAEAALGSAPKPQVMAQTDGVEFEKVAALKPDLILAVYSGLTAEDYAKLSKMAPTVAQPKDQVDYGVGWQELTRTVGAAVGRKAQAEKLVTDTEARIAQVKQDNPAFAGKTGLMATTDEGYWVYGTQDPRGRLLADLGFTLPAGLDEITGKEFGANLSKERTDLLDVDMLVWIVDKYDTDKAKVEADPLYSKLAVKTEGRALYVENNEEVGAATSFISVLSLPYLLDKLVPQMAAAVDGDPSTAVVRAN